MKNNILQKKIRTVSKILTLLEINVKGNEDTNTKEWKAVEENLSKLISSIEPLLAPKQGFYRSIFCMEEVEKFRLSNIEV